MSTRVRGVIASATAALSTANVRGSMSAKRATAPHSRMAFKVAAKVKGEVTTSSPGPTPRACSAATSATVPFVTAIAWRTPHNAAKPASSRATIGPCPIRPERRTSSTRRSASSSTCTPESEIIGAFMPIVPPAPFRPTGRVDTEWSLRSATGLKCRRWCRPARR